MPAPERTPFRVEVPVFSGPMDLLLHLVRERELEIADIPIGVIAEAFLEQVRALKSLDLETASEFLVLAATLMEIKARMLLPRGEGEDLGDEEDPRWELVQKLLEYRRFKDAATFLEEREALMSRRWPRPEAPDPEGEEAPAEPPGALNPWTCFTAYARIMRELMPPAAATLRAVEIPLEALKAELLARCPEGKALRLSFQEIYAEQPDLGRVVGVLLALLELVRLRLLTVRQEGPFGPLACERIPHGDAERN